uniref:CSON004853 protein n=1 Tax=Culicoides sonorensis TaxID=179676 RepID=A0A336LY44_CULSO
MSSKETVDCEEISNRIAQIVANRVVDLSNLWKSTFEHDIYVQHMEALVGHVQTFFDEVYEESDNRREAILRTIQNLRKEAEDLRRLLGVDFELNPSPNLPYYSVQCELDQGLDNLRSQLNARREHIHAYLQEQKELVESLDEKPRPLPDDPLPSEEDMQEFRRYLDDLKTERLRRYDIIRTLQHSVKRYIEHLEIQLDSDQENYIAYGELLQPTKRNIAKLEALDNDLARQYEDLKNEIDKYRSKLIQLWEFLQISQSTREKFDKYAAYNQGTCDILHQEYNRCESIKRENIEKYVQKVRHEIIHFWDMCYKSQEERDRFTPFKNQTYNEDLLTLHEMELAELKEYYEHHKQIFEMYEERQNLWEQMEALEKKKTDPNRYNNRGGQLLKEEKERKMINARIPKIESQLLELCATYQERTYKPFTINGKSIQEIIEEDYERKEEEKAARKKVAGSTPMSVSRFGGRTPQTGSALKNITRNNVMSATRTFSATKKITLTTTNSNLKRRLSPSSTKTTPAAKRNILTQMASTSFLRPTGSALRTAKSPAKGLKRRSIKRLSIKSNRRLSKRRHENRTAIGSSDTSTHSESMSYDLFENYVSTRTPLRSSVLPGSKSNNLRSNTPLVPEIKVSRAPRTPNSTRSASPGGSGRKRLATRTIPIMF